MPFKSEKQRRYMWLKHREIAQRWADEEKKHPKRKKEAGALDALAVYGLEKDAGFLNTGARWLGRASRALGAAPTGIGNIVAGGLGMLSGGMQAAAEGHGVGGIMAHAGAGALQGIPGVGGTIASMAAPAALNAVLKPPVPPPAPPRPGEMIGS